MTISIIALISMTSVILSPQNFDILLASEKPAYYPGEPVKLDLQITNVSNTIIEFTPIAVDWFEFHARGIDGLEEYNGKREEIYKCHTAYWPRCSFAIKEILPNETISGPIVLLEWFSKPFKPAKYNVICQIRIGWNTNEKREVIFPLTILPEDENEHETLLKSLACDAKIDTVYMTSCIGACELVASARSALAVKYQIALLSESNRTLNCILIDSLSKASTLESVKGIVEFVKKYEKNNFVFRDYYTIPTAIRAVYAIREKGDPVILKASEDFIKTHPCPPKPFLMPD